MSKLLAPKLRRRKYHRPPRVQSTSAVTPSEQPLPEVTSFMDDNHRHSMIAQRAYYRAVERGFEPGHELDDWLMAEREIEQWSDSHDRESARLCGD